MATAEQLPSEPRNGAPTHRDYLRLAAMGYPSIFAAKTGQLYFVDREGLLDGRCTFGPRKGHRRVDAPEAKPDRDEVHAIVNWFMRRPLLGQKTPTITSYSLKHLARESLGCYVTNGSMIVALDICGVAQQVAISYGPEKNTLVCVSKKSCKYLMEVNAT